MSKKNTINFLKRRIRIIAEQARKQPETAQTAYRYMEQVRIWARRNRSTDLVTATREAKNYIIGMEV